MPNNLATATVDEEEVQCGCEECNCEDCGTEYECQDSMMYFEEWCYECRDRHHDYDCEQECGCVCGYRCEQRSCYDCRNDGLADSYDDIPDCPSGRIEGDVSTATFLRLPRTVGLEVELENGSDNWGGDDLPSGIGAKEDGSLSYFPEGCEFVTMPGYGREFELKVRELYRFARNHNYEDTNQAGLHVHVDISDLDDRRQWLLVALVSAVQASLYELDPRRIGNSYASPMQWNMDTALDNAKVGERKREGSRRICHLPTYHGTAEFRLMGSTTDEELALAWASLCQHMVDYCANGVKESTIKGLARAQQGKVQLNALYMTVHLPEWARRKLNATYDERKHWARQELRFCKTCGQFEYDCYGHR